VVCSELSLSQAQRLQYRDQLVFHHTLCFARVLVLDGETFAFGFFASICKLRFSRSMTLSPFGAAVGAVPQDL
jgi:hypothetical protein